MQSKGTIVSGPRVIDKYLYNSSGHETKPYFSLKKKFVDFINSDNKEMDIASDYKEFISSKDLKSIAQGLSYDEKSLNKCEEFVARVLLSSKCKELRAKGDDRPIPFDCITTQPTLEYLMKRPYLNHNKYLTAQKFKAFGETIFLFGPRDLPDKRKGFPDVEKCLNDFELFKMFMNEKEEPEDHTVCQYLICDAIFGRFSIVYPLPIKIVIDPEVPIDQLNNGIELKTHFTSKIPVEDSTEKQNELVYWFSALHLKGRDKMICGFRSKETIVKLKKFTKEQIDEIAFTKYKNFSKDRCFNHIIYTLKKINEFIGAEWKSEDPFIFTCNHMGQFEVLGKMSQDDYCLGPNFVKKLKNGQYDSIDMFSTQSSN